MPETTQGVIFDYDQRRVIDEAKLLLTSAQVLYEVSQRLGTNDLLPDHHVIQVATALAVFVTGDFRDWSDYTTIAQKVISGDLQNNA